MGIARLPLEGIKASAKAAAKTQWKDLDVLRLEAHQLDVRPLPHVNPTADTIGVVAADAGLVSIELHPFNLEFLFVADSRENVHLAEILPLSILQEDIRALFERTPVLQEMLGALDMQWSGIERLWGKAAKRRLFAEELRLAMDMLREFCEWAVCGHLASLARKPRTASINRLILHDGLLRPVLFRFDEIRNGLENWWREFAWKQNGAVIVGVGKSSIVWRRLSLALEMDERVRELDQGYVLIDPDTEQQLTGRTAGSDRLGFSQLVLLKPCLPGTGYYLPVDVPEWLADDRKALEEVLCQISLVSRTSFPRPGYPAQLNRAHEAAHLTQFDAKVIRDMVMAAIRQQCSEAEYEQLVRSWSFQPGSWPKTGRL